MLNAEDEVMIISAEAYVELADPAKDAAVFITALIAIIRRLEGDLEDRGRGEDD